MAKTIPPKETIEPASKTRKTPLNYTCFHGREGTYKVIPDTERIEGSQGIVFTCRNAHNENFAVKVYHHDETPSPEHLQLINTIFADKPNDVYLLPVVDNGRTEDGAFFEVTKKVTPVLKHEIADFETLKGLIADLTKSLCYLHNNGILHRDISPENIYYDDSHAYIGDFGCITKINVAVPELDLRLHRTQRRYLVGKPGYAGPEIFYGFKSSNQSSASDFFSLGGTIASLISGYNVFEEMDEQELHAIVYTNGKIPYKCPRYLNEKDQMAVCNLIRGMTKLTVTERWTETQVNEWLKNPYIPGPNEHIAPELLFSPPIYFDGHFFSNSQELATAMESENEAAMKLIYENDFTASLSNSSRSLGDSVARLIAETPEDAPEVNRAALLSKVTKLLSPKDKNAFIYYKGKHYLSIETLATASDMIKYEMLKNNLITFALRHTSYLNVTEDTLANIMELEELAKRLPDDALHFPAQAFNMLVSSKTSTSTTACQVIRHLSAHPDIIERLIQASNIKETDYLFLAFLYVIGFRKQTEALLFKLFSNSAKYEKAKALSDYMETILESSTNDSAYEDAAKYYLLYLQYFGPDAWIRTFACDCTEVYISLTQTSKELLARLNGYEKLFESVNSYTKWNAAIAEFHETYTKFENAFQDNIVLALAGISNGKTIFGVNSQAFYAPDQFDRMIPVFCHKNKEEHS